MAKELIDKLREVTGESCLSIKKAICATQSEDYDVVLEYIIKTDNSFAKLDYAVPEKLKLLREINEN